MTHVLETYNKQSINKLQPIFSIFHIKNRSKKKKFIEIIFDHEDRIYSMNHEVEDGSDDVYSLCLYTLMYALMCC